MLQAIQTRGIYNRTNRRTEVVTIPSAAPDIPALLTADGFSAETERRFGENTFRAFRKGTDAYFLTEFPSIPETRVVFEQDCRNFDFGTPYADAPRTVTPTLVQVQQSDCGMGYLLRLSCGEVIVIDGGLLLGSDLEAFWSMLCEFTGSDTPNIALWILTHPHSDHYQTFEILSEEYAGRFTVERFWLNFPEYDDFVHYPKLADAPKSAVGDQPRGDRLRAVLAKVEETGAACFAPHTGECYRIGDAEIEILSTMEETIHKTQNVNATSLVFRAAIAGQKILFCADMMSSAAEMAQRYGEYLRSDIVQLPHHGFSCGAPEAEIAAMECAGGAVHLLPCEDENAFLYMDIFRPASLHHLTQSCCRELYTNSKTAVLSLPYMPSRDMRAEIAEKVRFGTEAAGKRVHILTGRNTGNPEDLRFAVLNTARNTVAKLSIDLFFENSKDTVLMIRAKAVPFALTTIDLTDEATVDAAALPYNPQSLAEKGLPPDAPFAMRILSDIPVTVITPTEFQKAKNRD